MASGGVVVGVIGAIMGAGGIGGLGLLVNAWRAHQKGKIEDEGTLNERLNAENKDLNTKLKHAQKFEQMWMTQAFRYRRQIAKVPDVEPDDMEALWDTGTPKIATEDEPATG